MCAARPLVSSSGITASVRVRKHGGRDEKRRRDGLPFAPRTPEATPKGLQARLLLFIRHMRNNGSSS